VVYYLSGELRARRGGARSDHGGIGGAIWWYSNFLQKDKGLGFLGFKVRIRVW